MEKHTCQERVSGRGPGYSRLKGCDNAAKGCFHGKWLCGIHSPDAAAKRKAKSDARYTEYSAAIDKKNKKYSDLQKLLKSAEKWMDVQTSQNVSDLYNAAIVYFERTSVIPD